MRAFPRGNQNRGNPSGMAHAPVGPPVPLGDIWAHRHAEAPRVPSPHCWERECREAPSVICVGPQQPRGSGDAVRAPPRASAPGPGWALVWRHTDTEARGAGFAKTTLGRQVRPSPGRGESPPQTAAPCAGGLASGLGTKDISVPFPSCCIAHPSFHPK